MRTLSIDIETYSSVDIRKSGLYKYVQSPDFEILLFAYAYDDNPVQVVDLAQGENPVFHGHGSAQARSHEDGIQCGI